MNVREILLPCGKVALVSEQDWRRVSRIAWSDGGGGYVRGRWKLADGGTGKNVKLHRFIMAAPDGYVVDHIDGNPLNNTRENLQITTHARNVMRSRKGGVTFDAHLQKWRVRKRVDGRMVSFGLFDTKEEADKMLAEALANIWGPEFNELGTVA